MERQAKDLKVEAWKGYPGHLIGGHPWLLDDEKVSYPMLEKARRSASRTSASTRACRLQGHRKIRGTRATSRRPRAISRT